jgi:hypothetical protein
MAAELAQLAELTQLDEFAQMTDEEYDQLIKLHRDLSGKSIHSSQW